MLIRYHLSFHWSMLHDCWFSDMFFCWLQVFGWCRGGPWEFDAEKNVPSLQVLRGKNLPAKISAKC